MLGDGQEEGNDTKAGFGRLANGWATKIAIADVIRNLDPLGSPGISA
jgi:hypothetical protein